MARPPSRLKRNVARLLLLGAALAACHRDQHDRRAPTTGGIVSLDPCADQLLVTLAPTRRIAAISRISLDRDRSAVAPEIALRLRSIGNAPADALALKPRLAIIGPATPAATRAALTRAGVRTVTVTRPSSLADVYAELTALGTALDENEAAKALAGRIDRAVTAATRHQRPVPALIRSSHGETLSNPLFDELLGKAGFADAAITGSAPRVIFADRPTDVRSTPGTDVVDFRAALTRCAGPSLVEAMARLREAREALGR